jgi:apolipoprotein N-acyltransferase
MYWFFSLFSVLAVVLIAIFAAYFALFATMVSLTRSSSPLCRALLIGLFAVGIEWLRGDAWCLRFPWYSVPHALAQDPTWIAPVRWLGTYGFSFAIWTIAAWAALGHCWVLALFALIPVSSRLLPDVRPADHRAVLIQAESTDQLQSLIRSKMYEPAHLAVLPEYAYRVSPQEALAKKNGPLALARKCGCPVVFGAVARSSEADFENVAAVASSRREILGTFTKQRPVPLFRDGKAGTSCPVFAVDSEMILGVAICYDWDGPEIASSLVHQGATLLVAPTFDALSWGRTQHIHHELLLRLRAVETDRWILRAASSGRSEAIDPRGRPSQRAVEIGEPGAVTVEFAYSRSLPWGARASILGRIAAAGSALTLLVLAARRIRMRPS